MTNRATPGARLRAWRKYNDLTQSEVAEALGVAQPTVAAWEAGTRTPSVTNAVELARLSGQALPVHAWAKRGGN